MFPPAFSPERHGLSCAIAGIPDAMYLSYVFISSTRSLTMELVSGKGGEKQRVVTW